MPLNHLSLRRYARVAFVTLCAALCHTLAAQTQSAPETPQPRSSSQQHDAGGQIVTTSTAKSEEPAQPGVHDVKATAAEKLGQSWSLLTTAAQSGNADTRIQALAALGTMGANSRAGALIAAATADPNLDVRTAAILAAGQTGNHTLTRNIRKMLDDKEPQVAFAAATTLWKMHDRSGEDILVAVVDGDRSAKPTMVNGTMHNVNKDLHHPGTLAKLGALEGASILLGPFGFGITAYEYMRKNGGDAARVTAIEQLSQQKTREVRETLTLALDDKDPAVRAAAAEALGHYRDKAAGNSLYLLLDDSKQPVRLIAAAAYINAAGAGQRTHPSTAKR